MSIVTSTWDILHNSGTIDHLQLGTEQGAENYAKRGGGEGGVKQLREEGATI